MSTDGFAIPDKQATRKWLQAVWSEQGPPAPLEQVALEQTGAAVTTDSAFYVARPADAEFQEALARRDCIILVKGTRQMGKTSLLARALGRAREQGAQVVLTDVQQLNDSDLNTLQDFYVGLGNLFAAQLGVPESAGTSWDQSRSPNNNFERLIRRWVLNGKLSHVFWGLDGVDRLFNTPFGGQVFGLFRAWYNKRALDPHGPWSKLTLAIAYATEAHLFITDLNQSPFNIGTRLVLEDFTDAQLIELNQRYGQPLNTEAQRTRFRRLLGGQPYLSCLALHALATKNGTYDAFEARAGQDEGVFGDHLRQLHFSISRDAIFAEAVKSILKGEPSLSGETFYRLRSAGVLSGYCAQEAKIRCQIYAEYLARNLT